MLTIFQAPGEAYSAYKARVKEARKTSAVIIALGSRFTPHPDDPTGQRRFVTLAAADSAEGIDAVLGFEYAYASLSRWH